MNFEKICFSILEAQSEAKVSDLISSVSNLNIPGNWRPIDNRETNYNVVTNQASKGSKALTELCTNMVDAILMKATLEKGIDIFGPDAPSSMIEAIRDNVKIHGMLSGIIAEVDDIRYLREFAEKNLIIGVTGGTRKSESICLTFVDNGEGQHPENFCDTFLSLSKGHKSKIPFVQGKYNMGSSGVLSFCGEKWYKLIISRRYDKSGNWGWTLIRRRPGTGAPVAEYFAPNGVIPHFSQEHLYPLLNNKNEVDEIIKLESGTIIKLFDYQLEVDPSFRKIRESLNANLVSTILPFRLMDYRYPSNSTRGGRRAKGIDERTVCGMEQGLLKQTSEENQVAKELHIGDVSHPKLGKISLRAIILPKLPGWLTPASNTSRVFHSVNGQVQFTQNRGYLSRNCKLPGLKDRIVVLVDASNLTEAGHNDVWKGDRETIRETNIGQLYKNEITDLIASNHELKELQYKIALEEIEQISKTNRTKLFQDLVDSDPSIAQLLSQGLEIKLPGRESTSNDIVEYKGKYSPTVFSIISRSIREHAAEIAIDSSRRVEFETDAENDYFTRPDNQGEISILGLENYFSSKYTLSNGKLTITFKALLDRDMIGKEINLKIDLIDATMPLPLTSNLLLKIVESRNTPPPGPPSPPKNIVTFEPPPSRWLTKDGRSIGSETTKKWSESLTELDGGYTEDLIEDQKIYYINYDNAHFRYLLTQERDENTKRAITEQYRVGMLILMLGFEDAWNRVKDVSIKERLEENIDIVRRLSAQGSASVVMSIARTLPNIINPSVTLYPEDD